MSWQASKWAVKHTAGSAAAKAVLMVLAEAAATKGATCYPSHATIAERAELSERCVWQAMADLVAAGLIERTARRDRAGHRTTDLIHLRIDQPARDAVRQVEPQPAADATREPRPTRTSCGQAELGLTANGAQPTRTSCETLPAPGAEEPVRREPVNEPVSSKRRARKRSPECPIPEGFPGSALIEKLQVEFPNLDAGRQAVTFRGHAETHDRRCANWAAAFRMWLVKAPEHTSRQQTNRGGNNRAPAWNGIDQAMAMMNEDEDL